MAEAVGEGVALKTTFSPGRRIFTHRTRSPRVLLLLPLISFALVVVFLIT